MPDDPDHSQRAAAQRKAGAPAGGAYTIEIADDQSILRIDESYLQQVAKRTLAVEEVARATISIAVVDDAALRRLNRKYLDHDDDTDVLSFLLECETCPEGGGSENLVPRGRGKRIEGEIVISAEMAVRRAAELDWSSQSEIVLYLVHGLLHLVGYDDRSEHEEALMRSRERAVLKCLGLSAVPGVPQHGGSYPDTAGPPDNAPGAVC